MKTRLQITLFLLIAVALWFLLLLIRGTPITWDHAWPFGMVVALLTSIYLFFERWAWSWKLFRPWIIERPDFRGTWKATLITDWSDAATSGTQTEIIGYMSVRQSLRTLSMRLMTEESTSRLIASEIRLTKEGIHQISGVYINEPNIFLRGERSEIHYGAFLLDLENASANSLSGHFWTDRKSRGSMILTERRKKKCDSYDVAVKLFKVTN